MTIDLSTQLNLPFCSLKSINLCMFLIDNIEQHKENNGIDNKKIYVNNNSIFLMGFTK